MAFKWTTTFRVQGSGVFPFDMLRYDNCFPHSTEDAIRLDSYDYTPPRNRVVTLCKYHELKNPRITEGRWRSFGWRVVPNERDDRICGTTKL